MDLALAIIQAAAIAILALAYVHLWRKYREVRKALASQMLVSIVREIDMTLLRKRSGRAEHNEPQTTGKEST
ncbi:MAG: hypothetical protein M5R41_19380 [Bacteroidia bacterium]|nr:hypothetical protein [Bacteroidia bacterium]